MTRDEFIDDYMKRIGIPPQYRTPQGFTIVGTQPRHALPIIRNGRQEWEMVPDEHVETHIKIYVLPNQAEA